jgi:hypothetical protein
MLSFYPESLLNKAEIDETEFRRIVVRPMKRIALVASVALLCAYQAWPNGARTHAGDRDLCAKHRIPLVTQPGFQAGGVLLVHYLPNDQFEKIDDQTPNRIADTQSLKRTKNISQPAQVTYCNEANGHCVCARSPSLLDVCSRPVS